MKSKDQLKFKELYESIVNKTLNTDPEQNSPISQAEYKAYAKISNEDAFFEVRAGNWTMEEFGDWCTVQKMEAQKV